MATFKGKKPPVSAVLLGGLAVVAVCAAGILLLKGLQKDSAAPKQSAPAPLPASTPTASPGPSAVTDPGVTWLAEAGEETKLRPYSKHPYYQDGTDPNEKVAARLVGTRDGNPLYVVSGLQQDGPGSLFGYSLAEKRPSGFFFLSKHSNVFTAENMADNQKSFNAGFGIDQGIELKSVALPETLEVGNAALSAKGGGARGFSASTAKIFGAGYRRFGATPYGGAYAIYDSLDPSSNEAVPKGAGKSVSMRSTGIATADGLFQDFAVTGQPVSAEGVLQAVWADGLKNKDNFRFDGSGGCGQPAAITVVAATLKDSELRRVGTAAGQPVYQFADGQRPEVSFFWDGFAGTYYDAASGTQKTISRADWYGTHHGVVLIKDALGDYVLYGNSSYGQSAECGKPVVYLYPQREQQVSVKVGADVKVSEPAYGNGWSVTARPDGTLSTGGKEYGSLFWEGTGHGAYPAIMSGTVVKRAEAPAVIRGQLRQLGLNGKETADFLDFWLPRLPEKPYVRLTWFGTKQLDELAPLTVSPPPDTRIRVFLDFAGLSQPSLLAPQRLSAPVRNGFTLVEWGGLLRR